MHINSAVHTAVIIFCHKKRPREKGIVACTAAEADDGAHGTHGSIVDTTKLIFFIKKSLYIWEKKKHEFHLNVFNDLLINLFTVIKKKWDGLAFIYHNFYLYFRHVTRIRAK